MPSWQEVTSFILRAGIGTLMLLGGTTLLIVGVVRDLHWPFYVICGSIIILAGLLAVCLDVFKELRKLSIELESEKQTTQQIKKDTEVAKNFDVYKSMTEKQTTQFQQYQEALQKKEKNAKT